MKGPKPDLKNVIPMKADQKRPVPDAPAFLCELGRDTWNDLAPILIGKDRLEPAYQYQFAAYCASVASFIKMTTKLDLEGYYYTTKGRAGVQQKKTAAWTQQQEAMTQMRRDAALFGLSPVDEARLGGVGQGDLFEDILSQLKGEGSASG